MAESTPIQKAWKTRKQKTKKHNERSRTQKVAAKKIQDKQWEKRKVDFLLTRNEQASAGVCVVCGDSRPKVLHNHHANPKKTVEVKVCANCHDIIRRSTWEDLEKAHRCGCPAAFRLRRIK